MKNKNKQIQKLEQTLIDCICVLNNTGQIAWKYEDDIEEFLGRPLTDEEFDSTYPCLVGSDKLIGM